jgi:hypothetical protein
VTIINYASSCINKLKASLNDDSRVVNYDRHMFIVQATGDNLVCHAGIQLIIWKTVRSSGYISGHLDILLVIQVSWYLSGHMGIQMATWVSRTSFGYPVGCQSVWLDIHVSGWTSGYLGISHLIITWLIVWSSRYPGCIIGI